MGFTKKKLPARSVVEDYTEDANFQERAVEHKAPRIGRDIAGIKRFAALSVIIIIALVLIGLMLSKVAALSSEVSALKARLVVLENLQPRMDRLEKEFHTPKNQMAGKQTGMQQQENRGATVKKAPSSNPRKKAVKPRT